MNNIRTQQLAIQNLHVETDGKEILHGIDLTIHPGEVHVIMGPNGSGKSTLANVLAGYPGLNVTNGTIMLDGEEITNAKPDERAKLGLFLSMQHPPAISGVTIASFLRVARNAIKGEKRSVMEFFELLRQNMELLSMDPAFAQRDLNEGFSGGERKRTEILQLLVLEPAYAVLDETDSGLDVDAINIVAKGINAAQKAQNTGLLLITHHNAFLEHVTPTHVHILKEGRIVESGGPELAERIEKSGFLQE